MISHSKTHFQTDRHTKIHRFQLVIILTGIIVLAFYGCASTNAGIQPAGNNIFRSEDYIVYLLPENQSPAELSEKFLGGKRNSWVIEEFNPGAKFSSGNAVVIPLKNRNKGGLGPDGFQTIPILTYHRFAEDCSSPLCMPTGIFKHQMSYLKENGYHVITAEDLLAFLEYRQGLPKKSVLITMDDGYRSVYKFAYPILKEYGFTATLFIYTSFVGVSKMAITWDQLKEMKADGFVIGSHTMYHSDLTKPKEGETEQEFIARIEEELYGSKKIIDKKLGQDTYFLAYPFGYYDQRAMQISKKAGYKIAMSVERGGNPFFADPMMLRRDQILKRDMKTFISRLKTLNRLSLK
jgi:peptidoglycan/xylan/chitin deacetylase (PgdA/CDA1 family)